MHVPEQLRPIMRVVTSADSRERGGKRLILAQTILGEDGAELVGEPTWSRVART
jgi:hypothetical protein